MRVGAGYWDIRTDRQTDVRIIPPINYWHCLHSMRSRVCETVRCLSIGPSVALSYSPAVAARSGFAAVGPVGRKYRLIAARLVPQQHGTAARRAAANAGSATFSAYIGS